jgi:hypothetical protein
MENKTPETPRHATMGHGTTDGFFHITGRTGFKKNLNRPDTRGKWFPC